MIRNYIRNRRIISGSISIEEGMKQRGCLGIYSGGGMVGAYMESFFNIKNISIERCRENEI